MHSAIRSTGADAADRAPPTRPGNRRRVSLAGVGARTDAPNRDFAAPAAMPAIARAHAESAPQTLAGRACYTTALSPTLQDQSGAAPRPASAAPDQAAGESPRALHHRGD